MFFGVSVIYVDDKVIIVVKFIVDEEVECVFLDESLFVKV